MDTLYLSSSNEYDNEGFFTVFTMLAHAHRLGREIVRRHGPGVRVYVYGAAAPGWLTAKMLDEVEGIEVRGFLDRTPERARETIFGIPVLVPGRNVIDLREDIPSDLDVLISAVNPQATPDLMAFFQERIPGVPVYFLHAQSHTERVLPAKTPFVIASTGRTGSTWLGQMMRYITHEDGYTPLPYRVTVTAGTHVRHEALSELRPGRSVAGVERFYNRLVTPVRLGIVKAAFLYRDPRDVQVSLSFKKHGKFLFNEADLLKVVQQILLWKTLPEVYCLNFENLRDDTLNTLMDLCGFLGINAQPDFVRKVIELHSFKILSEGREKGSERADHHYRKGIKGDWKNHFDEAMKKRVKELCGTLLIELGYERDLDW